MTYAVLAVLMALQAGQVQEGPADPPIDIEFIVDRPITNKTIITFISDAGNRSEILCDPRDAYCIAEGSIHWMVNTPRPRPQDLMPLVEPLPPRYTVHHCTHIGGSGNSPHLFDISEIYQCDEGQIEIAGQWTQTIEYGYVFTSELGRPGREAPRKATASDYKDSRWCATPKPWDQNQKERCGDKPTKCWDGKPGTWDPDWQGYSCATPDHKSLRRPQSKPISEDGSGHWCVRF